MTTADFARNRDNFCYRHPSRQSFVLCQRCARTICGECQTPAAVGVICPECLAEQRRARTPAQKRARRRWGRGGSVVAASSGGTRGMMWIFILTAVAFLVNWAGTTVGFSLNDALAFIAPLIYPQSGYFQPWRVVTVALTHAGFMHVFLNMLSLWMVGRALEPMLGTARFVTTYLLCAAGGSAAVALLSFETPVVGASGAVFGLFGALIVIARHIGADMTGMLIVLGINLVLGFIPNAGISWQSHVGGLVVGALIGLVFTRTRRSDQQVRQRVLLGVIGAGIVGAFFLPPLLGFPVLT
ncbi:rhomboid family intramembrane serine protease [Microbacterium sp. Marseille-Q6965]|uniref:rhomboid family intramembrane serine protease n=1 Tax=Microbacterium sp. Marseille-Q6965 TaxID=2965072 RepID=UPI0021B72FA3|nr:rhomboid family intramembrane serine protease [Microbacterium sp. Marseille-Q6965]